MSEEDKGSFGRNFRAQAWRTHERIRERLKQINTEKDPNYPAISKELQEIAIALLPTAEKGEWPKVLTIPHHGETYVSYRRMEGSQLDRLFRVTSQKGSTEDHKHIEVMLQKQLLPDNHLAVFPYPHEYRCNNPDTIKAIINRVGAKEYVEDYGAMPWDAMMLEGQDLYNQDEWTASAKHAEIILRRGNSVYINYLYPEYLNTFHPQKEVFPLLGEPAVPIHQQRYIEPNLEVDGTLNLYRKYAKLFLLDKGAVDKKKDPVLDTSGELVYTPLSI